MKIKLVPAYRAYRYECFECGTEFVVPMTLDACEYCDEKDNFHLMA